MKVRALDGSEAAGVRLLLRVMEHAEELPAGGWAFSAAQGSLAACDGSVWLLGDDGASVDRIVLLSCPCGCVEVTTYSRGAEVCRGAGPAS